MCVCVCVCGWMGGEGRGVTESGPVEEGEVDVEEEKRTSGQTKQTTHKVTKYDIEFIGCVQIQCLVL